MSASNFTGLEGVLAWQRLSKLTQGEKREQALKFSTKVLHPKRAMNVQDLADSFEEWEQHLHKLEALGHMGRVPELAKLVALRELIPREINEQVDIQQGLATFGSLRQCVRSRIAGAREKVSLDGKPMEVDAMLSGRRDGDFWATEWAHGHEEVDRHPAWHVYKGAGYPKGKGKGKSYFKGKGKGKTQMKGFSGAPVYTSQDPVGVKGAPRSAGPAHGKGGGAPNKWFPGSCYICGEQGAA